MSVPYNDDKPADDADREKILAALDELHALCRKYSDVLAVPEVVTLHDITEYRLDTPNGPKQFKFLYSRQIAVALLNYFAGTDYITPELFESTIVCALQDYFQDKKAKEADNVAYRTDQDRG